MASPNVIFILMDDLGWRDLTCYGSAFYDTPHLDQLAAEGMTFSDAYAACPVCSPTRASIMTGRYPARVGVTNFIGGHTQGKLVDAPYIDHLPAEETSLARALKQGGYATWHVGKWHLGGEPYLPDQHGFDVNIGGCHWGMPMQGYFSPWGIPTLEDGPEGEYLTDRLTDEAIRLIETHDAATPFYLNLCYYAVHIPIQAKDPGIAAYRAKAREMGLDQVDPFEVGAYFPCEHKKDKRIVRRLLQSDPVYAAMVAGVDENLGRLFAALEAQGLADDTVILFTSDNGGLATAEGSPTCNAPLAEGKGWMYEGGTREPLIVRWPGEVAPDSTCAVPVTSPDVYPTLLEIAGLDPMPEQHVDGLSLVPLLQGGERLDRDAIFWHYPHYGNQGGTPGASLRAGPYKLIEFFEDDHVELYNLQDDLGEAHDLAPDEPQLAAELHERLTAWQDSIPAIKPAPNPNYEPWQ
jgi:arylsulfatase A-like enzyme